MKRCTLGNRHKWTFVKNVVTKTLFAHSAHLSHRGIYRCACGAQKHGPAVVTEQQQSEAQQP